MIINIELKSGQTVSVPGTAVSTDEFLESINTDKIKWLKAQNKDDTYLIPIGEVKFIRCENE